MVILRSNLPIGPICAHPPDPASPDFSGEHRAKTDPPVPRRFVAGVDALFVRQVLHIPQGQGRSRVHHHRQANDLGARLEVTTGAAVYRAATLIARPARLNRFCSDSALKTLHAPKAASFSSDK